MTRARKKQRGAALIIVLLLVATLSFVLLSITNIVTAGVRRASAERARSELLWRAAAAEQIASAVIEQASAGPSTVMAPGTGIFAEPLELPFENGKGSIIFDGALDDCFNVNSVVTSGGRGGYAVDPLKRGEFVAMLGAAGVGGGEAERIADVIVDFLDDDPGPTGQGAEDNFYTLLPTPFRTADGLIASVSELRAMDGVTADIYRRIRPLLCAKKDNTLAVINANMLEPNDAPVLVGLGGTASAADFATIIEGRPPRGWQTPPPEMVAAGAVVASDYVEAIVNLELGDRSMEERLLFEIVPSQKPKLLARTFGEEF